MAPVQSPQTPWEVQVHSQVQSAAEVHWVGLPTHLVPSLLHVSPPGQGEVVTQLEQLPTIWQVWMELPAHWVAFSISTGQGSGQVLGRQQSTSAPAPHGYMLGSPTVPPRQKPGVMAPQVPPASVQALPGLCPPVPVEVVEWVLLLLVVVVVVVDPPPP